MGDSHNSLGMRQGGIAFFLSHLVPLTILQQYRDEGCLPVQSSDGEGSVTIAVLCIDVDPPACQQVKDMRVGRFHGAAGMGG